MATPLRRYGAGARVYDVLSGERWVYHAGREAGIDLLAPRRGDIVIDLGCGTGLNFPALAAAVGPEGLVVGVDRSVDMLAMARRRVSAEGWGDRIRIVESDAAELDTDRIHALMAGERDRDRADALFITYALSVFDRRDEAWTRARTLVRSGGRAGIVDMQAPTGRWKVFSPLAYLACATGGSDIRSRPWRLLERDAVAGTVRRTERKGGHLVVVAADLP